MKFYIVDAFTDKIFGGNPAGVVIIEGGEYPSFDIMRKTAAELRYSETAFIRHIKDNEYEVRYFTPTDEVDLCGHATIATFSVIGKSGNIRRKRSNKNNISNNIGNNSHKKKRGLFSSAPEGSNNFYGCGCYFRYDLDENGLPQIMSENEGKTYIAHTKAGKIEIDVSSNLVMMEMAKPELIKVIDDEVQWNELRQVLGLKEKKFKSTNDDSDSITNQNGNNLLAQVTPSLVSTGLPDILCPVDSLEELNSMEPDFDALSKLSERENAVGVHAYTIVESSNLEGVRQIEIHSRNFAPLFGIPEEAATGTSNGALTYYLLTKGIIKEDQMNSVEQGAAMGRPSRIFTIASKDDKGNVLIKVGGTTAVLSEGEIFI